MGEIMLVGWLAGWLTGLVCLYSEPLLDCTRTEKPYILSFSFICFSRERGGIMCGLKKDATAASAPLSLLTFC